MGSFNRAVGALCVSLAPAFSPVASLPPQPGLEDWYARLERSELLKDNARTICVPAARLDHIPQGPLKEKAAEIFNVLSRATMTAKILESFKAVDGAVCFANFDEKFPSIGTTAAVFVSDHNAVLLNESAAVKGGCRISAAIHEQKKLTFAIEADAHAIQALGSWMLSQPRYSSAPYAGAMDCMQDKNIWENAPYIPQIIGEVAAIGQHHPEWIENGQAAAQIYHTVINHKTFQYNYADPIQAYYSCAFGVCMQGEQTLEEMKIDLSNLGAIHFPKDYRTLPVLSAPHPAPAS
ncbi:MAG: hypothetical protein HYU57_09070 [Micavibrio aeruginosavorus]|nr:hypothetical protein [Micavibrio aeruginosavorus]